MNSRNMLLALGALSLAAFVGCQAPVGREYIGHVLPLRTVRFPGGNYSAFAVSNGLFVTCSHWTREESGGCFDVSDPKNIRYLEHIPSKGYSCGKPVFFGERCYIPNNFSLSVVNVKNPKRPYFECVLNPKFPGHGCNRLWVADGALYFVADKDVFKFRKDGLTFDRVEGVKPPKPVREKEVKDEKGQVVSIDGGLIRVGEHTTPYAYDLPSIAVDRGLIWVYASSHQRQAALLPLEPGNGGLRTFGPRVEPQTVASTNVYQTMGMQNAICAQRVGDLIFVDDGIVRVPRRGVAEFIRPRTAASSNMSVDGKRIAIAQCRHCRVIDFSNLADLKIVDFAPKAEKPLHITGCALEGDRLFIAYTLKEPGMDFIYRQPEHGFVAAFDVKNPAAPLGILPINACVALAKVGDYLYVTGRKSDFMVIDAKNPAALKLVDVRDDIQLGAAWKVKTFDGTTYVLCGSRILELCTTDHAHPTVVRYFNRGVGTAAPSYDDFTVDGSTLYAIAHASVDVFPLKGKAFDPVPNDCGVKAVDPTPLKPADAALFANHKPNAARPPVKLQAGRFGNACGAFIYDWLRLPNGEYAVAYGEAGAVLCDRNGRFKAELPYGADQWVKVFAKAVLEKDGVLYVLDGEGKAFVAFEDVLGKTGKRDMKGSWCSLGTSISWYNDNVANAGGRFTRGFQDRVMDKLHFTKFTNAGISGGRVGDQHVPVKADWYTVEHGVNDWGKGTPVGTMDDYLKNTKNGTFYANYRILIDKVRATNPAARIILCTPRKSYGFGTYLPKRCDEPKNGIYLVAYTDAVRAIAAHEKLVVADFYATCGEQDELAALSIDTALHPNDPGYQRMADELVRAFGEAAR